MPLSVTIANGQSLSPAFSLGGSMPAAILMPAAWTAAALTMQVSFDGTTFVDVYDDSGNELSVTTDANRLVLFDNLAQLMALGLGAQFKLRSGTSAAPVNQGAARTLHVVAVR